MTGSSIVDLVTHTQSTTEKSHSTCVCNQGFQEGAICKDVKFAMKCYIYRKLCKQTMQTMYANYVVLQKCNQQIQAISLRLRPRLAEATPGFLKRSMIELTIKQANVISNKSFISNN